MSLTNLRWGNGDDISFVELNSDFVERMLVLLWDSLFFIKQDLAWKEKKDIS